MASIRPRYLFQVIPGAKFVSKFGASAANHGTSACPNAVRIVISLADLGVCRAGFPDDFPEQIQLNSLG